MRGRRVVFAAAGAVAALALAAPAQAAVSPPSAFSVAKRGNMNVFSSVLVFRNFVDMRGGWLDESIGCEQWRRIRVRVFIAFTPAGADRSRFASRRKTRVVQNCAEGGPATGFTLRPSTLGWGCPNGRWRPGTYDFSTRTRHFATGLVSIASLNWRLRAAC
jgi:hypothetical protein